MAKAMAMPKSVPPPRRLCSLVVVACAWALVLLLSCAASGVRAQNGRFYYTNFRDRSYLTVNGGAHRDDSCLSLTHGPDSAGSVWYDRRVLLESDTGLLTAFNFHSAPFGVVHNTTAEGTRIPAHPPGSNALHGDGFAFVLHADPDERVALGKGGPGLGYDGLRRALVVEFDTHRDASERDPNTCHLSVHVSGDLAATIGYGQSAGGAGAGEHTGASAASAIDRDRPVNAFEGVDQWYTTEHIAELRTGASSTVQIGYQRNADTKLFTLKVYLNDLIHPILTIPLANPHAPVDAHAHTPPLAGFYYVGFTSATHAASTGSVRLCDWYFERTYPAQTHARSACDDGFAGVNCALDTRHAEDDCNVATRRGCAYCTHHVRDCVWCPSLRRCQSANVAILGGASTHLLGAEQSSAHSTSADGTHGGASGVTSFGVSTVHKAKGRHGSQGARRRPHPKGCTFHTVVRTSDQCRSVDASLEMVLWLLALVVMLVLCVVGTLCLSQPPSATNLAILFATWLASAGFAILVALVAFYVLIEITLSPSVALVFGVLFVCVSLLFAWTVLAYHFNYYVPAALAAAGTGASTSSSSPINSARAHHAGAGAGVGAGAGASGGRAASSSASLRPGEFNGEWLQLAVLVVFWGLMSASALACFVLDDDFAHALKSHTKVPLYMLLAASLCFALCFLVFETLYYLLPEQLQPLPKPFVQNHFAVKLMGLACIALGIWYGVLFGGLEHDDVARSHMSASVARDNDCGYPLALLVGGCVGFVMQCARLRAPASIEMRYINADHGDDL